MYKVCKQKTLGLCSWILNLQCCCECFHFNAGMQELSTFYFDGMIKFKPIIKKPTSSNVPWEKKDLKPLGKFCVISKSICNEVFLLQKWRGKEQGRGKLERQLQLNIFETCGIEEEVQVCWILQTWGIGGRERGGGEGEMEVKVENGYEFKGENLLKRKEWSFLFPSSDIRTVFLHTFPWL